MASIHSEKRVFKSSLSSLFIILALVVTSMAIIILLFFNIPGFNLMDQLYDFYPNYRNLPSNYIVPNIGKSMNNDTVMINTFNTGSYTFSSAKLPWKIVPGKVITFVMDIEHSLPSIHYLEVTITGAKGQYLMFLPYTDNRQNEGKIEFHYVFSEVGTYNVDIAFGAPEGVNFNVVVNQE